MGTRCGNIDPGVLIYLMTELAMDVSQVADLLYHRSGLLGLSGISHDVRELLASDDPRASHALEDPRLLDRSGVGFHNRRFGRA